jgi:hypothetical protein
MCSGDREVRPREDARMFGTGTGFAGRLIVVLVMGVMAVATAATAGGLSYDVTQEGTLLGTITPFESAETAADFYEFGVPHTFSGAPAGLPLGGEASILYIHLDTNTGVYSLGWIHGKEGEGINRNMHGTIVVTDDVPAPAVLVSDDPGSLRTSTDPFLAPGLDELAADGSLPRTFNGIWRWGPRRTDGGAVGPIGTTPYIGGASAWITYVGDGEGPMDWLAASANGSTIPLTFELDNEVRFTATPELPPFALGSLALPFAWFRYKLRRRKRA